MKKKFLIIVLALILATSVLGCSPKETTAATTAASTTQNLDKQNLDGYEALFPAQYSKIQSAYTVDATTIGTVLFAAEGKTSDGKSVVAMTVRSSRNFNTDGFSGTGWDEAEPSAYMMIIVVDKATQKVVAWRVITDGTKAKQFFVVPDDKINSYMTVAITGENVFDSFTDGLVLDLDVEFGKSSEGSTIIAGTSIVFSGTSVDGTLSGQLVRHCFRTAAYYFSNYAK